MNGKEQEKIFTIKNGRLEAKMSTFGAEIKQLRFCGTVIATKGITIGRYANRIAKGRFSLDGKEYSLAVNENGNILHGGPEGFYNRNWTIEELTEDRAVLSIFSPDGDQGFPGNLTLKVSYTITDEEALLLEYRAETDAPTVVNFTNHMYFNLNGGGDAAGHRIRIDADHMLEADSQLIPTGKILPVEGTRFDMRTLADFRPGFDDGFASGRQDWHRAATLGGKTSGVIMYVYTDQPGMQLYNTASEICLETQHYPDSPNHPDFPTTVLRPGEVFRSRTEYAFSKVFTAPGRTELGGNHTDHQHGRVLAAGIDLYINAKVHKLPGKLVKINSEGYAPLEVDISSLEPVKAEENTSAALVRGIAARISQLGYEPGGFEAGMRSEVLSGSGLSSSAAYEVLIGRIFNDLYCGGALTDVQIAQIGQYAENVFFGKPCGLMDQMACSVGNIVAIDFKDPARPVIEQIDRRFEDFGYALCIIDTHTEHADLTGDYASIPADMCAAAGFMGKKVLREVDPAEFEKAVSEPGCPLSALQISRARHFFAENERAGKLAAALKAGDFSEYLRLVNESGRSSEELLKNIVPQSHPESTGYADCITLARKVLGGKGAVRVHGGGFAGTIQAYVPLEEKDAFREKMESVLGKGSCHYLKISR